MTLILRHSWEDNIRIDVREREWEIMNLMNLLEGQGPVAGSCEQDHETLGSVKAGNFLTN
jgi:hypothetical protein